MPVRTPSALTKTREFSPNSSIDDEGLGIPIEEGDERTIFTLRFADGRAYVSRANIFSKVSYKTEDESGISTTERDFPMGDLQLETLMLVFHSWNLKPAIDSVPYPITHKNIMALMAPEEIKWLYDHAITMNTCWGGAGEG